MKMRTEIHTKVFLRCLRVCLIIATTIILPLFLDGCSSHKNYSPRPDLSGYSQSGKASYYSKKFQSRKTASGERFDNYAMTAAHKHLPLGTKVIVTNINNGRSVEVRINDRGPYVKGRIIDLSRAAFEKIENLNKGLAEVKIRVID
jgi:rare lipoprotein A